MEDEVRALREELKVALRPVDKARKALDGLAKAGALKQIDRLSKHLKGLKAANLEAFALEDQRQRLVEDLEQALGRLRRERRMALLGPLQRMAGEAGIPVETVAETPPTLALSPLTAELDFEAGEARLCYARETVETAALEPEAILEARGEAMAAIKDRAVPSEAFFGRARDAYRMALVARGSEDGERLDLVDLLAPLTLLATDRDEWRKRSVSKMDDFPRYLLAYQLQRLRRDGVLERDGVRLELGTATGGATKDKRNVLFVPSTPTEGQYYLSIRFVTEGTR
ncbi:MAG: hypothetical protein ACQEXJ_21160 [Myxococcota bacterium]